VRTNTLSRIIGTVLSLGFGFIQPSSAQLPVDGEARVARQIPTPDLADVNRLWAGARGDRLLIVERRLDEVWIVDLASGDLLQLGGEGEGPGEYRGPSFGGWTGDSIWVTDPELNRIVVYGPEGQHVRTVPSGAFSGVDRLALPTGLLSGGIYFLHSPRPTGEVIMGNGVNTHLTWLAPTGEVLRSLTLSTRTADLVAQTANGGAFHGTQPFAQFEHFVVDPNGGGVWTASGSVGVIAVRRFDALGREVFSRTVRYDAPELRRSDIEGWIDQVVVRNRLRSEFYRPIRDAIKRPETWPMFDRITAGTDGSLWLRHPHSSGDRWRRVCEVGEGYVLRFPEAVISVLSSNRRVLGIRQGQSEVPEIVELVLPDDLPPCAKPGEISDPK